MSFIKVVSGLEDRNDIQKYLLPASGFIVPLVVSVAECYHPKLYFFHDILIVTFRHTQISSVVSLMPVHLSHTVHLLFWPLHLGYCLQDVESMFTSRLFLKSLVQMIFLPRFSTLAGTLGACYTVWLQLKSLCTAHSVADITWFTYISLIRV